MLVLVLVPASSLAWSAGASVDVEKDLLIAAYCLLACCFGMAQVLHRRPSLSESLALLLLAAGNVAAAASLVAWGLAGTGEPARLVGVWGLDNPVHGSVLVLGSTLPALALMLAGRRSRRWVAALALPLAFALLAGARTAAAAYLLAALALVGSRQPRAAAWAAMAALVVAGVGLWLIGVDRAIEIWLSRGLSYRDVVWQQVWTAYRDCPALVGCGIATPLSVEFAGVRGERAHSIFVAALYHQGLVGLTLFVGAVAVLLWRGVRDAAADVQGWAWMLGFVLLANATSGDHLLVRGSLFWPCFWIPALVLAARAGEKPTPGRP
ncbi:MAG: hypothetical protein RIC56_01200 [Pseudomonadales bacterium]